MALLVSGRPWYHLFITYMTCIYTRLNVSQSKLHKIVVIICLFTYFLVTKHSTIQLLAFAENAQKTLSSLETPLLHKLLIYCVAMQMAHTSMMALGIWHSLTVHFYISNHLKATNSFDSMRSCANQVHIFPPISAHFIICELKYKYACTHQTDSSEFVTVCRATVATARNAGAVAVIVPRGAAFTREACVLRRATAPLNGKGPTTCRSSRVIRGCS